MVWEIGVVDEWVRRLLPKILHHTNTQIQINNQRTKPTNNNREYPILHKSNKANNPNLIVKFCGKLHGWRGLCLIIRLTFHWKFFFSGKIVEWVDELIGAQLPFFRFLFPFTNHTWCGILLTHISLASHLSFLWKFALPVE